jgi:CheY-like chemotaxis protein
MSQAEIARRAGGKRRFEGDSRWAVRVLPRLVESGIVESDSNGHYRLRSNVEKKTIAEEHRVAPRGLLGVHGLRQRDGTAPLGRAGNGSVPAGSPDHDLTLGKVPARGEPGRNEKVNLFYRQAPAYLMQLQSQCEAVRQATTEGVRQQLLGGLAAAVHSLAEEAQRASLNSTHRLASALEKLSRKLHQRVDHCMPTALGTAGVALDLLEELCRSETEPDLAAPPVRILVVDDDLIARRAFAGAIQGAFGRSDCAASGEAALASADEKQFDLIFLDVRLPGVDGFTTCSRIHQTTANRHTPVVFVTGHSDLQERGNAVRSGGCGLIPKPMLASELVLTALTFVLRTRLSQPRFAHAQNPAVLPRLDLKAH